MEKEKKNVEIYQKVLLTIEEAAQYSHIGQNKISELLKMPRCNFVLYVGKKKLVKRLPFEDFLMKKYRDEKFPVTIVRPSHTYDERSVPLGVHGKNGSWQVIKRIKEGKPVIIHGDGTSLWTMTHNSDFAKAFVGLLGNIHAIGETFHITSDESLTWNQIYQSIANALGVELKACHVSSEFLHEVGPEYDFLGSLVGDKSNSVVFDNSKVKKAVPEFCATKRFDQGIKETLDYVLSHPECQKEDPDFDKWCDKVIEARENAIKSFK